MKYCPKCNTQKDESEFGILSTSKDGLSYACKKCLRKKMQKWLSNPDNREKVNRNAAQYRRTEKGKATKERYYYSEKGQKAYKRYNCKSGKRKKAREAVNHAVETGKLPQVDTQVCAMNDGTCDGRMEYHHHKGYDKKHWFDVVPLCRKHHCIADGMNYHDL